MKKVVSMIAVLGMTSAFAGGLPVAAPVAQVADDGIAVTVGGAVGFGMTHWKAADFSKGNGFASSVNVGLDFNKYFGAGLSCDWIASKPKVGADGDEFKLGNTWAIALMGKLKAPVMEGLNLFAKLGVDYLISCKSRVNRNGKWVARRNFNVAYGFGVDYSLTDDLSVFVEWNRFNGRAFNSDIGKYQPNADVFKAGVNYRICVI